MAAVIHAVLGNHNGVYLSFFDRHLFFQVDPLVSAVQEDFGSP